MVSYSKGMCVYWTSCLPRLLKKLLASVLVYSSGYITGWGGLETGIFFWGALDLLFTGGGGGLGRDSMTSGYSTAFDVGSSKFFTYGRVSICVIYWGRTLLAAFFLGKVGGLTSLTWNFSTAFSTAFFWRGSEWFEWRYKVVSYLIF